MRPILLALILLTVSGCADMSPLVEALSQDKTPVCVKITSIWVSTVLDRYWGCEMPGAVKAE